MLGRLFVSFGYMPFEDMWDLRPTVLALARRAVCSMMQFNPWNAFAQWMKVKGLTPVKRGQLALFVSRYVFGLSDIVLKALPTSERAESEQP
jgi:hypothetical protein